MKIEINGKNQTIYQNAISRYVIMSAADDRETVAEVKLTLDAPAEVILRPLSAGITPTVQGNVLTFSAPIPSKLSLELQGGEELPVFFFLYAPEEAPTGEHIITYPAGEHAVDELVLSSGDTLYLAEGAILHAHLVTVGSENVTVCGRGILDIDGEYSRKGRRMTHLYECKNLTFRDITMTGSYGWSLVFTGCEGVTVDGVNIMTWVCTGDGIDIVGSHDVTVQNCFIRTADDCIAIKAVDYRGAAGLQNVYNVNVRRCVMWNAIPGNGIEIGFETRCDEMYDITFEDIDLIHCEHEGWQSGGSITVHNGDRARIHHITYRDIRVEDSVDKLFDFKVLHSNYSRDDVRGSVEDVLVERVALVSGRFPPSILSGFSGESPVRNIRFVDCTAYGQPIRNMTDCRMVAERTKEITFEVSEKGNEAK